jgi:AraC-like DNA-binding protein
LFYLHKGQRKPSDEGVNVNEMLLTEKTRLLAAISHEYKTPFTLALVKEWVETQGGSITVSSELGEGTSFTVSLPVSMPSCEQETVEKSKVNKDYLSLEKAVRQGISEKDRNFIEHLKGFLEQHFQESELNACMVYTELAVSERQFHRKMKALLEQPFSDYVKAFRLKKGAQMLCCGISVTQTAFDCGFSSQSYFSACFKTRYGMTPKKYQKQGGLQVC